MTLAEITIDKIMLNGKTLPIPDVSPEIGVTALIDSVSIVVSVLSLLLTLRPRVQPPWLSLK